MFFAVYYLLGICSVVRMLWETFFAEADFRILLGGTAGISAAFMLWHGLWRWKIRRWRWRRILFLFLPLALAVAWRYRQVLEEGYSVLYQSVRITSWNHFYPSDPVSRMVLNWDGPVYLAFGAGLAVFGLFLYLAAAVKVSKAGVLTVLIPPLAAVLAVGVTPSFGAMSLMILCCVGVFAGSRRDSAVKERSRPLSALAATAVSLALLGISGAAAVLWSGQVEEQKLEARQRIREIFTFTDFPQSPGFSLPDFPGLSGDPGELSNQERIRYTGRRMAAVETESRPEETVYLKNYQGSEYTGHGWDTRGEAQENSFAAAAAVEAMTGAEVQREMTVTQYEWQAGNYEPYFSWEISESYHGTGYRYFPRMEYLSLMGQTPWEEVIAAWAGNSVQIREVEYLQWPEELQRLKEICDENPMGNVDEIRQFIVSWLADTCRYNLQVGSFPEDQDPIAYFLFEKREGYCQHFASAAVMMFRMYGVPARYATGLAVSSDLFERNGNTGTWTAYPTDRTAHAWVEIYQERFGWIPVEVTPGGAAQGMAQAEAENLPDLVLESMSAQEEQTEATPTPEITDRPEQQPQSESQTESSQNEAGTDGGGAGTAGVRFCETKAFQRFLTVMKVTGAAAGILAFLCLILWIRREIRIAGRGRKNVTGIFGDLLEVLVKGGLPADSDWLEDDFAQTVCRRFSWLDEREFQKALDLAAEAAYGNRPEISEEKSAVRKLYLDCCRKIFRKMNRWEKFRFRVWDAYF